MQYFDPETISPEILEKLGISSLSSLQISKEPESKPMDCLNNVNRYIAKYGGELQFGWLLTVFGNVGLQLTAHAVVKNKDQTLVCVTLDEHRNGKVNFAPDDEIQSLIKNNFLPAKFIPLVDSDTLNDYLTLMEKANNVRVNSRCVFIDPVQQIEAIKTEASMLYPEILSLAKKNTSQNDLCFCGSGVKRKKCCG